MNKMKARITAAALSAAFFMIMFPAIAYAHADDPAETPAETTAAATTAETTAAETSAAQTETDASNDQITNAFPTDGTGTLTSTSTEKDGKEFYTVMTPAGNVFYLIIDKSKSTKNVYFLDAAKEKDLIDLAAKVKQDVGNATAASAGDSQKATPSAAETKPADDQKTDTTKSSNTGTGKSNKGMLVFIVIIALGVGSLSYYFKILKPRKDAFTDEGDDDMEIEDTPEKDEADDLPEPEDNKHTDQTGSD